MLIAFEGLDGSGKSTQIRMLKERATELFGDREVIYTREPGGTPNAELIRDAIFALEDPDPQTEALMFGAARRDHLRHVIVPAISQDKVVITDRYIGSTYAFQVGAGLPREDYVDINFLTKAVMPFLTVYLDATPEVCIERLRNRGEGTRFDQGTVEYHQRIRESYEEWLARVGNRRYLRIDANGSAHVTHSLLMDALKEHLQK